jgi:hypothetical protein
MSRARETQRQENQAEMKVHPLYGGDGLSEGSYGPMRCGLSDCLKVASQPHWIRDLTRTDGLQKNVFMAHVHSIASIRHHAGLPCSAHPTGDESERSRVLRFRVSDLEKRKP